MQLINTIKKDNEYASRPVRVKFYKSNEVAEGNIIFSHIPGGSLAWLTTTIRLRFNDAQQTECLFNLLDIEMIYYLSN